MKTAIHSSTSGSTELSATPEMRLAGLARLLMEAKDQADGRDALQFSISADKLCVVLDTRPLDHPLAMHGVTQLKQALESPAMARIDSDITKTLGGIVDAIGEALTKFPGASPQPELAALQSPAIERRTSI